MHMESFVVRCTRRAVQMGLKKRPGTARSNGLARLGARFRVLHVNALREEHRRLDEYVVVAKRNYRFWLLSRVLDEVVRLEEA